MWTLAITLALKVIGLLIGRSQKNADIRKKYLQFVHSIESKYRVSVKLNSNDRKQISELDRRRSLPSDKLDGGN